VVAETVHAGFVASSAERWTTGHSHPPEAVSTAGPGLPIFANSQL